MARLLSCAYGLQTLAANVEVQEIGAATLETTLVRSPGCGAVKITGMASGVRMGYAHQHINAAANGPFWKTMWFRPETLPTAENTIFAAMNAATIVARITIDQTGVLRLYDEDGVIGSPSAALTLNAYVQIGILVDATGAGSTDIVRGYLSQAEFAGSALRNLSTGINAYRWGGNMNLETQTQGVWYLTDHAINDSAGTVENGLPGGAEYFTYLRPNAAGDAAATTGTFADIDEVTPNDVTDYIVIGSLIAANYRFQTAASAGIGASDSILLVQLGLRHRAATAASAGYTPQLKSQSAGTTLDGTATTHDDTTWRTNGDLNPRNYKLTSYVDPQAGGPWTPALLDTMIGGVNVTDATPNLHITALWAVVAYIPRAPADNDAWPLPPIPAGTGPVSVWL